MNNPSHVSRVLGATLVSVAAYNASTGLDPWWWPAWIAPVGILLAAYRTSWRTTALLSLAVYFGGALRLVPYLASIAPLAVVLGFLFVRALACTLVVLMARRAANVLPLPVAAFAFPVAWTAFEFAASASPHGTFLSLAYTQAGFLPLVQVASVTGIWGVTFVLALAPSAVAIAVHHRASRVAVPALACVAAALAFGTWRLGAPTDTSVMRVGLAATDDGAGVLFENDDPAVARRVVEDYARRAARLAEEGVTFIVLPEKLVGVPAPAWTAVTGTLGDTARSSHATIVAGLNLRTTPPRNVALVVTPDGRITAEYDKRHLLPGDESGYTPGVVPGIIPGREGPWGVAICKDMDFPAWLRQYGQRDVRIVAVPAWDFVRDGHLHARMAVMRGVENGFAVVRVAIEGLLTVSDAYGRILAETTSAWRPAALLVAAVPVGPGTTIYARAGDWFAWLNVAAASVLGVALVRKGRVGDAPGVAGQLPPG